MQQYDIAAKVLMESCSGELIRYFLGIDFLTSTLIEALPQETVSLKRSDYPVLITDHNGVKRLVIIEIQTAWDRTVPLDLLDYRTRYLISHPVAEVVSCIILLKPSGTAADYYEDNEVIFKYRLIKMADMDANDIIDHGPVCLLPFVPLMKNGREKLDEADSLICKSEKSRNEKADMLTTLAIFSGLVSKELPAELIARRKDIMMESAAYDIIKKEGFDEGKAKGREEGRAEALYDSAKMFIEIKFGIEGVKLQKKIPKDSNADQLELLLDIIRLAESTGDVEKFIDNLSD